MDTLKRFLCDWGSPDSNMLLFFLLTSFLLGLLAGWLIWGRKIQAMLEQVAERDVTITDLNGKLTIKEADLAKANKTAEDLMLKNRTISEEKGQLHADLMNSREEFEQFKLSLAAPSFAAAAVVAPIVADIPSVVVEEPEAEVVTEIFNDDIEETTMASEVEFEVVTPETVVETSMATEAPISEEPEAMSAAVAPDDLKIVEGIGPKIEGLLNDAGIWTFRQLADSSEERLREILDAAGRRYQMHDPSTWARQSLMAYEGKWDELKAWQDALKGGKE
jgi:predicted flap endonuclease-1-like 5' DNA nuclease